MAAKISIESEIGTLKRVVVHRPGVEIERMTQHELDRLLFDDILSPDEAAREHDVMTEVLRSMGAEVLGLTDLLSAALENAPKLERRHLVDRVCAMAGVNSIADYLADWPAERLAHGLVSGVYWRELEGAPTSLSRIRAELNDGDDMALRPQPNLMFMRDPCMCVQDRVLVGRMATHARAREPELVSFALRHSGAAPTVGYLHAEDLGPHHEYRALEGGDVLVPAPSFLLIGCSERTTPQTIEHLAKDALFDALPNLERVYAVMMPAARSVMHLDTILTQVDRELFLGHRPLNAGQDGKRAAPVARISRGGGVELLKDASVFDVIKEELGAGVKLIPCGGEDPLYQEREQWTDGANAVCLSPGHIILYSRNRHTIRALTDEGFEEVRLNAAQPDDLRKELLDAGNKAARTVYSFSGSELSRARGGGRCLTMPLEREGL